jgi:acyl carrier protein
MDTRDILLDYIRTEILKGRNVDLSPDDNLLDTGVLDSLGILQLVAFSDERLGIQIPDEDVVYENFYSVNALADYLNRQHA